MAEIVQGNYVEQVPDQEQAEPTAEQVQASRLEQMREMYATAKERMDVWITDTNIASQISEQELATIGALVVDEYEIDKESRSDWEKRNEDALSLANMIAEEKRWGGAVVSNVKYPILATACIQFESRALPSIIKGNKVVAGKVVGKDPDGLKAARAERLGEDMSHQLLEEMPDWEGDMDTLLTCLPLAGLEIKKTYRHNDQTVSEFVNITDFVVHYKAKSVDTAPRQTHLLEFTENDIVERVRAGIFLDKELGQPAAEDYNPVDTDAPHDFLEQHRTLDLDGDGYKEPYVVTVHKETRQVVRIVARWDSDGIDYNEIGEIVKIEPVNYFTGFKFMPAFDGSCYGMGFGVLLQAMNKTVNTTINQLLDAGTLANRQCGFLGKGIRLGKSGSIKFKPGEWKTVENMGADLRSNIVPLPAKDPSNVLFQLLGMMIDASKELSSVTDLMAGVPPGANTSPTTVLALIEQGMKVFSAIYRRVYKSLKLEYKKVRRISSLYRTQEEYERVVDCPEGADVKKDYRDEDMDVVPISDTADISDTQRLMKAEGLNQLVGKGLNDKEIYKRYLEALQIPSPEKILEIEDQGPTMEQQMQQFALELQDRELKVKEAEAEAKIAETREKLINLRANSIKALADAEAKEVGTQVDLYQAYIGDIIRLLEVQQGGVNGNNQGRVQGMERGQPGNIGSSQGGGPKQEVPAGYDMQRDPAFG